MKRRTSSSSSQSSVRYPFIENTPKGLFLNIRLQPRSSKNQVEGTQGNALKVRLTAPPVEGEANRALIEFLSDLTGLRKSSFTIGSGLKSRDKRVAVEGVAFEALEEIFSKKV